MLAAIMALVVWTMVMWTWMYATRIPSILKMRMKLDPNAPRGQQMSLLPPHVRWKADNYNHLFEQPTIFYVTAFAIQLSGAANSTTIILAWGYVVLRIIHSLWQSIYNIINIRFYLFSLSSLVLVALIWNAIILLY